MQIIFINCFFNIRSIARHEQFSTKGLEKENSRLHRIIDKFHDTIDKFIHWIVKKFGMGAEDNLVRDFEVENHTFLNAEKQVRREDRDKELDLER